MGFAFCKVFLLAGLLHLSIAQEARSFASHERSHIPGRYFVKLEHHAELTRRGESLHSGFHKRAQEDGIQYDTRYEYTDADLFVGMSVQLKRDSDLSKLASLPGVAAIAPVGTVPRPGLLPPVEGQYKAPQRSTGVAAAKPGLPKVPRRNPSNGTNSVHSMTGVDALHGRGIKGKGVKIAIIDTGVDYKHPALGGCFGPGCTISFGYDLVGDDYGVSTSTPSPDSDPLASCGDGGHGTHVAGILGMQDEEFGLTGVAPEAELGMYRIFGCGGASADDVIISAINRAAAEPNVRIISMSFGRFSDWTNSTWDPLTEVVDGVAAKGIAMIAANGNDGSLSPMSVNSPGSALGSIGVGSVENARFETVYNARDSNGVNIEYGSVFPIGATELDVVPMVGSDGTQYGCQQDDWNALASKVKNFSSTMVLARRGPIENIYCGVGDKVYYAMTAGFTNIAIFNDIPQDKYYSELFGYTPTLLPDGSALYQVVSINNRDGEKAMASALRGSYTWSFADRTYHSVPQAAGYLVSNYSSQGLTAELDLKPQLSAPGGIILSTFPLEVGGYAYLSGTSMATPYLSGVTALLLSQSPGISNEAIRTRLQNAASQLKNEFNPSLITHVPSQGAGLVDAFKAVYQTSHATPPSLRLGYNNDLTPQTITIVNPSDKTVTYDITHLPAALLRWISYPEYNYSSNYNVGAFGNYASVTLATMKVEIAPGGSANVVVKFTPPNDIASTFPMYSGFIQIRSSIGETLSVPYAGVAVDSSRTGLTLTKADVGRDMPCIGSTETDLSGPLERTNENIREYNFNGTTLKGNRVVVSMGLKMPTRLQLFDAVPASTTFKPDMYGFDPSVVIPDIQDPALSTYKGYAGLDILGNVFTFTDLTPNGPGDQLYFGPILDGNGNRLPMPKGDYRIVQRTLRWNGDRNNPADYESWMSGVLRFTEDVWH